MDFHLEFKLMIHLLTKIIQMEVIKAQKGKII